MESLLFRPNVEILKLFRGTTAESFIMFFLLILDLLEFLHLSKFSASSECVCTSNTCIVGLKVTWNYFNFYLFLGRGIWEQNRYPPCWFSWCRGSQSRSTPTSWRCLASSPCPPCTSSWWCQDEQGCGQGCGQHKTDPVPRRGLCLSRASGRRGHRCAVSDILGSHQGLSSG